MFIKMLVVGPFASNCYIVGSETTGEALVIDPGDEANKVLKALKDARVDCKLIVATHAHIDHISGVKKLKEATGASFAIHEAEQASQGRAAALVFGLSYDAPPQPDRLLKDGDTIELGEINLKVLHTPGHTPGGISLAGHGVVFSGDTLFNQGIGRTDFPGGSETQLLASIRDKLLTLPDDTVVLSGHGPKTDIGTERQHNPWLQ